MGYSLSVAEVAHFSKVAQGKMGTEEVEVNSYSGAVTATACLSLSKSISCIQLVLQPSEMEEREYNSWYKHFGLASYLLCFKCQRFSCGCRLLGQEKKEEAQMEILTHIYIVLRPT